MRLRCWRNRWRRFRLRRKNWTCFSKRSKLTLLTGSCANIGQKMPRFRTFRSRLPKCSRSCQKRGNSQWSYSKNVRCCCKRRHRMRLRMRFRQIIWTRRTGCWRRYWLRGIKRWKRWRRETSSWSRYLTNTMISWSGLKSKYRCSSWRLRNMKRW